LLITKHPLELYFKPLPGAFDDNILRVAPDILPPSRIRLTEVWIDDERHSEFDRDALTVRLPQPQAPLRVKVRLEPANQ
jgi:hypothetical protein